VRYISIVDVGVCIQLIYDSGCIVAALYHILDDGRDGCGGGRGGGRGGGLFVDILFHFWIMNCEEHIIDEPYDVVVLGGGF